MNSFRLKVQESEVGNSQVQEDSLKGAMVIRAKRGTKEPFYIQKGDVTSFIKAVGTPDPDYPDIRDGIAFIKKYGAYVSCPSKSTDVVDELYFNVDGVTAVAPVDGSNLFVLKQASPSAIKTYINNIKYGDSSVTFDVYDDYFKGETALIGSYEVSVDLSAVNGFKQSIYVEDVFEGNTLINIEMGTANYPASPNLTIADQVLESVREAEWDDVGIQNDLALGVAGFANTDIDDIAIMFVPAPDADAIAEMGTLRKTKFKYTRMVGGIASVQNTAELAKDDIISQRTLLPNDSGMTYYCNQFLIRDTYSKRYYWSNLIGEIASRLADSIDLTYGGIAPAFTEENGVGGKLDVIAKKAMYRFDADQLEALDNAGINPVLKEKKYGVIIEGDRTGHDPALLEEISYLPQAMMSDYIIPAVFENIFVPQLTKNNDEGHRNKALSRGKSILEKIEDYIEEYIMVCDESNNDGEIRGRKGFKFGLAVKFEAQTEWATFDFVRVGQGTPIVEVKF